MLLRAQQKSRATIRKKAKEGKAVYPFNTLAEIIMYPFPSPRGLGLEQLQDLEIIPLNDDMMGIVKVL